MVPETDHIVEIFIKITIVGRRNYNNRGNNRNYRSNYRDNSRSSNRNSYRDGNRYNHRSNYRGDDSNQAMAIEAKIAVDLGTETGGIGVAPEKVLNPGVVPKTDMKVESRVEMTLGIGTG